MIVELCGLPGSGKTTIARRLEERAGFIRIKVRGRKELLWLNFLFLIKRPVRFFVLLGCIIRYSADMRMFYYKFTNLFLQHNAKHEKALRYQNAVIDQGYFQNIISLFEVPISERKMLRYMKFFRFPDLLLMFDASDRDIEKRVQERGYSSREEFGEEYVHSWRKITSKNYRTLLKNANQIPIRWKIIDANKSIDEVYNAVIHEISI